MNSLRFLFGGHEAREVATGGGVDRRIQIVNVERTRQDSNSSLIHPFLFSM